MRNPSPQRVAHRHLARIAAGAQDDYGGVDYDEAQAAVERIERGLHPGPYKIEVSVFSDPGGGIREFVVLDKNRKAVLGEPWGDGSANPLRFNSKREAERFIRDIPAALGTGRRASSDILRLMKPVLNRIEKDMAGRLDFTFTTERQPRGEMTPALVIKMNGKDVTVYGTGEPGLVATNLGKPVYDKAGVNYRFMQPLRPDEIDRLLRSAIDLIIGPDAWKNSTAGPQVTGIQQRNDLKPRSMGWTTNPNTYGKPTFYEIQGTGLTKNSERPVLEWLKKNRPDLTPGHHELGHGASTESSVAWDPRQNAWIAASYFTYAGG